MRTDSVNLSSLAVQAAKKEITELYGEAYSKARKYTTKSKGAQEAHEAIRPTYLSERELAEHRRKTVVRLNLEAYNCVANGRCCWKKPLLPSALQMWKVNLLLPVK